MNGRAPLAPTRDFLRDGCVAIERGSGWRVLRTAGTGRLGEERG